MSNWHFEGAPPVQVQPIYANSSNLKFETTFPAEDPDPFLPLADVQRISLQQLKIPNYWQNASEWLIHFDTRRGTVEWKFEDILRTFSLLDAQFEFSVRNSVDNTLVFSGRQASSWCCGSQPDIKVNFYT